MALYFDNTISDQFLHGASAPVSGLPLTLSCWVNPQEEFQGTRTVFGVFSTSGIDGHYALRVTGLPQFPINAQFESYSTDGAPRNWTVVESDHASYTPGVGVHVVGTFTASQQDIFVGGTDYTAGAAAKTFSSLEATAIGHGLRASGGIRGIKAYIAECAIWNVALTISESLSLAHGAKPSRVRPGNLVFWKRMIRDEDVEIIGGMSMTPTGPPLVAPWHPPILGDRVFQPVKLAPPPAVARIVSIGGGFSRDRILVTG